jgi:nucleoside-diphosphate-sugar epimerase
MDSSPLAMKKVLVTGANGFVGRHSLPLLRARGYEIHAISRTARAERDSEIHWHTADLLDGKQVPEVIERIKPTHLLHLAWYTEPGKYWAAPENLQWLSLSIGLLAAFADNGGARVVVAGTCAEYEWNEEICSEETSALRPSTLYGNCKHALRLVLEAYTRQIGLSSAWARLFFPYGPHERPDRFIPSVICALLENEVARCSHGNQQRDFLFVEDAAAALVALLESNVSGPINIASGQAIALKDIASKIGELLGRTELIRWGAIPAATGEPQLLVADVRRLRQEVGWRPEFTLDQGLAKTVRWWKHSGLKGLRRGN